MTPPRRFFASGRRLLVIPLSLAFGIACHDDNGGNGPGTGQGTDGPTDQGPAFPRQDGDPTLGQTVFRFETFNNERFFTDALRLPAGMTAAGTTPLQLLGLGVSVDLDAIPAPLLQTLQAELQDDPSGQTSPLLNDPNTTLALLNANAVVGLPVKDSNGDGVLDLSQGDKAGTSCALCHTRAAEAAILTVPNGGSIGRRQDGLAAHNLNFGGLMALAANSRALYPVLQLSLSANGGATIGRATTGLTEASSEAEVDAYLANPQAYPVGMFDDTFDGNGDPMHNAPLFRQDLAAPFGTDATIARLDNFSNLVYTGLLDPTTLTTPGGRAFLHKLGGAAGDEIADDYVQVLAATGVTGYPFVDAAPSAAAGTEDAPLGVRVDDAKLLGMNAYLASLAAPAGVGSDAAGRELFRTVGAPDATTSIRASGCRPSSSPWTASSRVIAPTRSRRGNRPSIRS